MVVAAPRAIVEHQVKSYESGSLDPLSSRVLTSSGTQAVDIPPPHMMLWYSSEILR